MPKLDVMSIMFVMLDTVMVVLYLLFVLAIFFSVRTVVHNDDADRFSMEMGDIAANSELAAHMNVFSIDKMNDAEKKDIDLYARSCEFSFVVELEQAGARKECSGGEDCRDFCSSVCGSTDMSAFGTLTGTCGCNFELFGTNYCQCRKNTEDSWHEGYYWKLGKMPVLTDTLTKTTQEFPSGIAIRSGKYEAALPAKLTVTGYDSLAIRAACIALKAYDTKEKMSVPFDASQIPAATSLTLGKKDDKICLYTENAEDCRKMDIPLAENINMVNVLEAIKKTHKGMLTAYPLKGSATCDDAENSDSLSKPGDETPVENVLLCVRPVG